MSDVFPLFFSSESCSFLGRKVCDCEEVLLDPLLMISCFVGLSFFGFWAYRVGYTCDLTFGKEHAISAGPKQLCTTRCNSFYRHAILFNMLFSQL